MRRDVILPIAGGVIAALVLVGALLLVGHRHKTADVALISPVPSASVTPLPPASITPSPAATAAAPSGSPGASTTPAATAKPTPTPHPVRAVSSVDCSNASDAKYCSAKDGALVQNKKSSEGPFNPKPPSFPDAATISMQSSFSDGHIHAVVTVENKTSKTFVFPSREIDFEITKNRAHFATLKTHGGGFEMAPGAKMTGTFDQDVTQDGAYDWQAKVWYWTK